MVSPKRPSEQIEESRESPSTQSFSFEINFAEKEEGSALPLKEPLTKEAFQGLVCQPQPISIQKVKKNHTAEIRNTRSRKREREERDRAEGKEKRK